MGLREPRNGAWVRACHFKQPCSAHPQHGKGLLTRQPLRTSCVALQAPYLCQAHQGGPTKACLPTLAPRGPSADPEPCGAQP